MKRKEVVRRYKKIAKELDMLEGEGANHISRMDNKAVFEFARALRRIAGRIKKKYPVADYENERDVL